MKTTRRNRPVEITDAPEHRAIPMGQVSLEAREDTPDELTLVGYASTYDEYEMHGGPAAFGWTERIDPGAFEKTLREKPDLHLLINHAGMPLARTKSGTLTLAADDQGLKVEAQLDRRDPEVQALEVKMRRGDMDEMSFAFRVKAQEWGAAEGYEEIDDQSYRTITEVSLHKGDVSVVNWGANPTTHAEIKATDVLAFLADANDDDLVLLRQDSEKLAAAWEKLSTLHKPVTPVVNIETLNVIEDNKAESIVGETGDALTQILTEVVERIEEAEGLLSRADSDDDPAKLVAALDATLDQAVVLIGDVDRSTLPADIAQACDLVVAAEALVDELMDMLGIFDPDDEADDASDGAARSEEIVDQTAEAELSEPITEPTERGMSLTEALALQGVLAEMPLTLSAALAYAQTA